jgi:glutathione S-transferase
VGTFSLRTSPILSFVADRASQKDLLPQSGLDKARAYELLALLSSTIHVAFRPLFRPERLAATAEGQKDVAAVGLAGLRSALQLLDARIGEGPYALGETFTLCDLYLFVFVLWSRRPALEGRLGALPYLDAFGERMATRPSVRAAMRQEGLSWPHSPAQPVV